MDSVQNRPYRDTAGWRYDAPDSAISKVVSPPELTAEAKKVAEIFALADVEIGSRRPWDLQVYDDRFYQRLLSGGSLASGESYMDGWWDAEALDQLCARVHSA